MDKYKGRDERRNCQEIELSLIPKCLTFNIVCTQSVVCYPTSKLIMSHQLILSPKATINGSKIDVECRM